MLSNKTKNQSSGFTLLELMIGLVVMSVVISIFAWGTSTVNSTARLRSSVMDLIGLINFARTRSAITMRTYRMQFCTANKTCTLQDKTLKDYSITNPIPRGLLFVEQCGSSKVDGSPCGDPGQSHEIKYYNLQVAYRDVEISSLMHVGETQTRDSLMLYFRTDGSVSSCTATQAGPPTCVDSTYYVCLRTIHDVAGSQPTYIPRRMEIAFDGRVSTYVDTDNKCK